MLSLSSPRRYAPRELSLPLFQGIEALRILRRFAPRILSCPRIPPGSPVLRILLDVGSFLCGRDAIAKTFASPMAPKGLSLPLFQGIEALRILRRFAPRILSCLRIPPGSPSK